MPKLNLDRDFTTIEILDHDEYETHVPAFKGGPPGTCYDSDCGGNDHSHHDYDLDRQLREAFMAKANFDLRPLQVSSSWEEKYLVLLPNKVYGFVLKTRKWGL